MSRDPTDWRTVVQDLSSDRIAYLAFKALFDPRSMSVGEIQELAAAVVAHLNNGQTAGRPH